MMPLLFQPIANMVYMLLWIHTAIMPTATIATEASSDSTVLKLLQANHAVTTGFVCKSPSDIVCIDSLCNDASHFWTIEVNGDYIHFEARSPIKEGDDVKLSYGLSKDWR